MLAIHEGPAATVISSETFILRPRWLMEASNNPAFLHYHRGSLFDSFVDFARQRRPRRVCLVRSYALGDILMLVPVVKILRRTLGLPEPVLVLLEDRFYDTLSGSTEINPDIRWGVWRGLADYACDVHYNLDSCLEVDHRGGKASDMHRVELYAQALGLELR